MGNTYRAVSAYGKAVFPSGVFEQEFTVNDEADHLSGGHLEIVPRTYRVLSTNYAAGKQGDEVSIALVVEHEANLIRGGVIERVDKPANTKKKD